MSKHQSVTKHSHCREVDNVTCEGKQCRWITRVNCIFVISQFCSNINSFGFIKFISLILFSFAPNSGRGRIFKMSLFCLTFFFEERGKHFLNGILSLTSNVWVYLLTDTPFWRAGLIKRFDQVWVPLPDYQYLSVS